MKLLMISGDKSIVEGKKSAFYNLLEEFCRHWERIDVIVPGTDRPKTLRLFDNVFFHPADCSKLWQWRFIAKKGEEIFRREKFEVMTVQEYPPFYNGLGAALLSQKIKKPYLLEFHHIIGYPRAGGLKEFFYSRLAKKLVRFDASGAAAVRVVNKKQTAEFLVRHGVPEEKIKYIPSFYLDFEVFRERPTVKKYDLVFAARLEKNKGILNLVKAVKILKKQKPDISLLIIGDGSLKEKLQSYVQKNDLIRNVVFSGWLATLEDVARAYGSARIFVNPSFNEGGPRVLLEAMSMGLPAVTARVGVALDLIKDGESGLFCDWPPKEMAQKIGGLLNNEALRKKMGEAGRQAVQGFEKKAMIENYAREIKKMA